MVQREQYLEKLRRLKDTQIIKVITGIRRCGKSTLLQQFRKLLVSEGVAEQQIVAVNFEDIDNEWLQDYRELHAYVSARLVSGQKTYVFLDEAQMAPQFQKAVNSLFLKENIDLYITGSNAWMLSGELATLLSGRYIEIKMLPFSFAEYYSQSGSDLRTAWRNYFMYGGFPYAAAITDTRVRQEYLAGIYNTVLLKDIIARTRVNDVMLLESVTQFLFDNVGNIVSSKKIADSLATYGRKTTSVTIEGYIRALTDACVLYKAGRYDVKGKQHLKSLEKYYLADPGLRWMLLGERNTDIGHLLENIVYLELLRRGYVVSIGKIDGLEVDFVAQHGSERLYIQVAASVLSQETWQREVAPLKKIADHYPKYIITLDELPVNENGIRQINALEFLLGQQPGVL